MNIAYEQLNNEHAKKVTTALSKQFAENEIMSQSLKVAPLELEKLFAPIVQHSFEYSCIATDTVTDDVVGAIICNDLVFFLESHLDDQFTPELQAIITLLSSLEENFTNRYAHQIKRNSYFYQYVIYVDDQYQQQGIAKNLYKFSEEIAKRNGFPRIVTIPTGKATQFLCMHKFGYKKQEEILYNDFRFNGEPVFSITDPPSCMLVTKDL